MVTQAPYKPLLTLFIREGCHLCDDLQQTLTELLDVDTYRLEKVDIDSDAALKAAYNVRVPVLKCENIEVCEHFLDLEALQKAFEQAHASYNGDLCGEASY